MPVTSFNLTTLGELRLVGPSGPLLSGRRKELALLTYIARRSPKAVPRDELAALLWGERDEERARQSLRHALHQLRRAVDSAIEVTNERVRVVDGAVDVDASLLERDVASGHFAAAAQRWTGPFLRGVEDAGDDAFRAWVEREREAIRRSAVTAFTRLVADARAANGVDQELAWARRWTDAFPDDDTAHARLIDALHRRGLTDEARAVYSAYLTRLRTELDLAPSLELIRLGEVLARATSTDHTQRPRSGAIHAPMLVGRGAAILASLAEVWARIRAEGAGVVLEGESGTGRTRLCSELVRRARTNGRRTVVLEARPDGSDADAEWSTLRRLMADVISGPSIEDAPNKPLTDLADALPALRGRFPHLGQSNNQRIEQAFREVLRAIAARSDVLLVVDDVGRADAATRKLMRSLVCDPTLGVMVVVTVRSDVTADAALATELGEVAGVRRFKLSALARDEVAAMAESMLELAPDGRDALAVRLFEETRGIPLRVTKVVSALVDTGAITLTSSGVWELAPDFAGRARADAPRPETPVAVVSPASAPAPLGVVSPRAELKRPAPTRWWFGAAVAALLIVVAVPIARRTASSLEPPIDPVSAPRVAVMDLELVSPDTLDAFLATGLTEEINSSLSRVQDILLKSRASVRSVRASGVTDPARVGQALGVDYLVEGSVRRVGRQLRAAIRLTKASDGFPVWSGDFDDTGGLPQLHDRIAREVATRVGSRIAQRTSASQKPPTADAQAYEHYLRGNYYLARRTPQTVEQAIAQYRIAVARDSSFAAAKARIAYSYALLLDWGWARGGRPPEAMLREGFALVESAIHEDSTSADVLMARAYLLESADPVTMKGAAEAFERAIAVDPRNAEAIHQYAQIHEALGNWDAALAAFRRALVLEPDRSLPYVAMASIEWKRGHPADARRLYDSALVVDPGASYALSARAILRLFTNDPQGALEDAETAVRVEEGYSIPPHSVLAQVLMRTGSRQRAELEVERALSEIVDPSSPSPTDARFIGGALLAVGRENDALNLLERARPRGAWLWFYCLAPDFDAIRTHPRFVRIMGEAHPGYRVAPPS
jgi:DNA-binding SARP family transcriptional activator/TolB-like protein/tetratricopeptide (TPR) repeat protein